LLPVVAPALQAPGWCQGINALAKKAELQNHRGLPIRFVPQTDLPADTAYEAFISETGGVPTRENLHDFFNALVWLTFPKIKIQLNALQAREIAKASMRPDSQQGQGARRGKLRDAATIFDENAALLVVRNVKIVEALRDHRWSEVFLKRRAEFGNDWEIWLFGHALMEKLVTPYKAITAHALPVVTGDSFFGMSFHERRHWLDTTVSQNLSGGLSVSDFTPLPILGVPGWWHGQDAAFYGDVGVFRPKKVREADVAS
jgi:hypothetical protein